MRWGETVEPVSTVRGSPEWWQAGYLFARAAGGRVLAACVVARGRQGPNGGPARLHVGRCRREAARSHRRACAHLRTRVTHATYHFSRAQWGTWGLKRACTHLRGHEDGELVEVHRRARCWSSAIASLAYAWMLSSNSARRIFNSRSCSRGHKTVSWGRGEADGLAKGNAGMLSRQLLAEADTPAIDIADLLAAHGGT